MHLFEPNDIRCVKNPKSTLWGLIKWNGYHDLKITDVETWGAKEWHKYRVTAKCKKCGAKLSRFGVPESKLIGSGFINND